MIGFEIEREAVIEVVGTQYDGRMENHKDLVKGQKLKLERMPDNEHDENAIIVRTLGGKDLGFIPKGRASVYAPAIDSGKYDFDAEVLNTSPSDSRPILVIKVTADYRNLSEESVILRIRAFLQNCVNSCYQFKESFNECISEKDISAEVVIERFNNARLYSDLCNTLDNAISEYSIEKNNSRLIPYSKELLLDEVNNISVGITELLKKFQRIFNESVDIEDEDEYQRVQSEIREKRKRFKDIGIAFRNATDTVSNYKPLNIEQSSQENEAGHTDDIAVQAEISISQNDELTSNDKSIPQDISLDEYEMLVELIYPDKYSGTKPVYFIFKHKRQTVKTWRAVYTSFISLLYNDPAYENIMKNLIGASISGNPDSNPDFVALDSIRFLRRWYKIANNFFVEVNLSSIDILRRIRELINICELSSSDLIIVCKNIEHEETKGDTCDDTETISKDNTEKIAEQKNNDAETNTDNNGVQSKSADESRSLIAEPKNTSELSIKELIVSVMKSDDERVTVLRGPSSELSHSNGLTPNSIQKLVHDLYHVSLNGYDIAKCLLRDDDFRSIGKAYYVLNSEIPQENDYVDEDLSDSETSYSETANEENTTSVNEFPDVSENIFLTINSRTYRASDVTDALCKICEFAIRVKPFMMARITYSNMQTSGKNVFCRNAVNLQGYRKLSNNLQVAEIATSDELKILSLRVLSYCNIDEKMVKFD